MARTSIHVPARLHVLLARAAPVGVIFRRGPSAWVEILRWNTDTDEIEQGQWFHGRIYERRCDLSPDGQLLVYFASKFSRARLDSDHPYSYAWTAVSRPPYLTAVALWPKRNCWHGGGLFDSRDSLELNHRSEAAAPHPDHVPPRGLKVRPNPNACGEDSPIWDRRMARDGWVQTQPGRFVHSGGGWRTEQVETWERTHGGAARGERRIILSVLGIDFSQRGGHFVEAYDVARRDGPTIPIADARWADFDQAGRLVFARGGSIYAAEVVGDQLREQLIADLGGHMPRQIPPPPGVTRWP